MKACVRNSSRRARSCQETDSAAALMTFGRLSSEGCGGAGTDDLTRLAPDVAEAVWELTREIISLAGAEHPRRTADGELDASADDDPRLLAAMREHLLTGRRARRVALVQHRELAAGSLRGNEPQRYLGVTELHQLIGGEERLRRIAQIEREELGERHRDPIQHFLQRADRGTHAVLLDERDEAVGDSRAPRELALRKPEGGTYAAQSCADVDTHGVFKILNDRGRNIAAVALFVISRRCHLTELRHGYYRCRPRRPRPLRARGTLASLHGEPPVQGEPATARAGERHALLDAGRPADPRCRSRAVVRERGARPARDHRG